MNFFNPAVIVIGGDIAHADEHLLAGVREVVYRRSTALATRSIRIARSTLDDRAGILGAAVMVIEAVLAPDAVDQAIAATPRPSDAAAAAATRWRVFPIRWFRATAVRSAPAPLNAAVPSRGRAVG